MIINLKGKTILVTRPDPAGAKLCEAIKACGGHFIHLPTIIIKPPQDLAAFEEGIAKLNDQDWLIFISPQAVYAAADAVRKILPFTNDKVKFAAQGEGTAKALQELGFRVDIYPTQAKDSEALLDLPVFQKAKGLRITVIRGVGGRELIGKTLSARGALVTEALAYRRERPDIDITPYLKQMQEKRLSAIVSLSFESINNLKSMVDARTWPYIRQAPVIVMSERVKKLAESLFFETIWVIPTTDPTSLLKIIAQRGK